MNQRGQTSLEYILLISVVITLFISVYNSDLMQEIFGEDGSFITIYQRELEFNYRHGLKGREVQEFPPNYSSTFHPTYIFSGSETRFFGPLEPYP